MDRMQGYVGVHCVVVGSALKNNVVQAGLVFDVLLYIYLAVPIQQDVWRGFTINCM